MNSYISMPSGEETPEKPDSGFIPPRQAGMCRLRRRCPVPGLGHQPVARR
jgi:hypothetical protein